MTYLVNCPQDKTKCLGAFRIGVSLPSGTKLTFRACAIQQTIFLVNITRLNSHRCRSECKKWRVNKKGKRNEKFHHTHRPTHSVPPSIEALESVDNRYNASRETCAWFTIPTWQDLDRLVEIQRPMESDFGTLIIVFPQIKIKSIGKPCTYTTCWKRNQFTVGALLR